MAGSPAATDYGTCRLCGDAVPPGAARCPICGQADPIRAGQEGGLDRPDRRHYRLVRYGRATVVVGVIAMLVVLMVQAVLTPAPVAANPLTETSVLTVPP